MKTVQIFDTTLRDGEQAPGYSMNNDEKVRMALQLETLGVDVMEAGFAAASPGDFKSVKAIADTVKSTSVCSLSRALEKDIDASAAAIGGAARPRIHTFIATSDLHLKCKLRISRVAARNASAKEWKLESFVVNSGNHMSATAQITLVRGKRRVQDAAMGTGPIYAAFRAVEKIIRHRFTLEGYRIEAVTERRDTLGEVLVKISDAKGTYRGRGVSTDVIEGSILALLVAVNRMMEAKTWA